MLIWSQLISFSCWCSPILLNIQHCLDASFSSIIPSFLLSPSHLLWPLISSLIPYLLLGSLSSPWVLPSSLTLPWCYRQESLFLSETWDSQRLAGARWHPRNLRSPLDRNINFWYQLMTCCFCWPLPHKRVVQYSVQIKQRKFSFLGPTDLLIHRGTGCTEGQGAGASLSYNHATCSSSCLMILQGSDRFCAHAPNPCLIFLSLKGACSAGDRALEPLQGQS